MTQTQKYVWIIKQIYHSRDGISLRELSDRWEREGNPPILRGTFYRWIDAICEQFKIDISHEERPPYRYFIANPEDINDDRMNKWLMESVSMGTTLMGCLDIKDRIMLENVPTANEFLTTIITAMKSNRQVQITFRGFGKIYSSTFPVQPLFIKLFQNRWYMVARRYYKGWGIRTFCLDRIEEAVILDEKFEMPEDFVPEEYFANTYGVSHVEGEEPYKIVFRVQERQKYYFMTLPMHHSQRLIADEGSYADFEVTLVPTDEFFFEMLKNGSLVEIISPKEVVDLMKEWVNDLYYVYNKD